jgi:azurin
MKEGRITNVVVLMAAVALGGCKEKEAQADERPAQAPAAAAADKPPEPAPAKQEEKPPRVVEIASKGNLLEFDVTKLTVKEGERIKLVFNNKSTLDVMPHNWVLIRPGTADKVGAAGQEKGEAGHYVEPGPDVLAYTPVAKHGTQVEVVFTAPAAGEYDYICTVMGHWISMKGKLIVEKP